MPTATNQHLRSGNAFQSVSVSVALLLLGMRSVAPLGAVTVAVSEIDPVADELIGPVAL